MSVTHSTKTNKYNSAQTKDKITSAYFQLLTTRGKAPKLVAFGKRGLLFNNWF